MEILSLLKLMHGEEVIGTLQSQTETTLEIKKALTLMQGPQGLAFGTFFSTADQDKGYFIGKRQDTVYLSCQRQDIEAEYKKVFTTVVVPDKPKIIV